MYLLICKQSPVATASILPSKMSLYTFWTLTPSRDYCQDLLIHKSLSSSLGSITSMLSTTFSPLEIPLPSHRSTCSPPSHALYPMPASFHSGFQSPYRATIPLGNQSLFLLHHFSWAPDISYSLCPFCGDILTLLYPAAQAPRLF